MLHFDDPIAAAEPPPRRRRPIPTTTRCSCSVRAPPACPRRSATPTGHSRPRSRHWRDALGLTDADRFQIATPPSHILGLLNLADRARQPARWCGCTAASTSTRCCATSKSDRITVEMAVAPIALAIASHPGPRALRPLVAALHHVGRDAGHRAASPTTVTRRTGVRWVPGLRRQRAAGHRVQPARPDAAARLRRAAGARRRAAGRVAGHRRAARPGRGRRDPGAQPSSVMAGYLPDEATGRRVPRRLVPHRRRRLARRRGLGAHHRPVQGDDQGPRLPGRARRDRGRAARAPGREGLRGVRRARRPPTGKPSSPRSTAARCPVEAAELIALVGGAPGVLQTPEPGRVRARNPAPALGQGAAPSAEGALWMYV